MFLTELFQSRLAEAVDVNSEAFLKWFGNSKIVDEAGKPLRLYRGIYGPHVNTTHMQPREGYATFYSTSPYVAGSYGTPPQYWEGLDSTARASFGGAGAIFPVYIKAHQLIEYPVKIVDGRATFDMFSFDTIASRLGAGQVIVARGVVDIGPRASHKLDPEKRYSYPSDIYGVGKGTSVKSAISNNGAFSVDNENITEAARKTFPLS